VKLLALRTPDTAEVQATRLVTTYADTILRLSYTYLHSTADAEDICQTVLLARRMDVFFLNPCWHRGRHSVHLWSCL